MCEFEEVAIQLIQSVLRYEHVIVFSAILQKDITGQLKYITIEELCTRTSLHARDTMKYLGALVNNKFLDMYPKTINKRRIFVYGVNYAELMNVSFATLQQIYNILSQKYDFFCETCNNNLKLEECLNKDLNICCPSNENHTLMKSKCFDKEKATIETFMRRIQNLKGKVPLRNFVRHFKRSIDDSSQTDRVVVRKS